MTEIILGVAVILGVLFMICKLIGKTAQVFGLDEITRLMGESLSIRLGDFSSRQKSKNLRLRF